MKIFETYTLGDLGFYINFQFPRDEITRITDAMKRIRLETQKEIQDSLDRVLAEELSSSGYVSGTEVCQFWLPEFRHSVDIYNPEKKIAIEVEKAEKKRVVHDILKLINGSNTFVPKVRYGVLVLPQFYLVKSQKSGEVKKTTFATNAKQDIKFYFGNLIPSKANMQDMLVISYSVENP